MPSRLLIVLVAVVLWLTLATQVTAQTLLRWKLQPGQAFVVQTRQQTESQVAFSGQSVTTKIELAIALSWSVVGANKNTVNIDQTVERIEIKLESPTVGAVHYDSSSTARPTGQAREI